MGTGSFLPTWITEVLSLLGSGTGLTALTLGVLNFRRDRARVRFEVRFNMTPAGTDRWTTAATVRNIGRRPVHVSHVGLCDSRKGRNILSEMSIKGQTLVEGAAPWSLQFMQTDDLIAFMKEARHIRAYATVGPRRLYSRRFRVPAKIEAHLEH